MFLPAVAEKLGSQEQFCQAIDLPLIGIHSKQRLILFPVPPLHDIGQFTDFRVLSCGQHALLSRSYVLLQNAIALPSHTIEIAIRTAEFPTHILPF